MSFWLGATSAMAVYMAVMTVASLHLNGTTQTINKTDIVLYSTATIVFMVSSWYLATFGGS